MDRGDRREDIFLDDVGRQELLKTLAEACQKTGWQVHAYRENHSGELHRETAEQKADRIIAQAMARVGWEEPDLACGLKHDPRKLAIAVRLRKEPTLPRSTVVRCLRPDGDLFYLHHAPDPKAQPLVLLHCPVF